MRGTIRTISAVLAGALLSAVLIGVIPGSAPEAKAALGPLQAVTLTGADFHPDRGGVDFINGGYYVRSNGAQVARIPFPAETVVITSIKARYYDNDSPGYLCVTLYRARPGDATDDELGSECTSGASTTDPQTLTIPNVFGRVGKYHTAYLLLESSDNTLDLKLYGATVFYRVVT